MPHETPMTNMKMSAKEAKGMGGPTEAVANQPKYPYGLRISLNDETLKKMGITNLPKAGEKMKIYAAVDVAGSSANDTMDGGKSLSMELQITDLALIGEVEKESPEKKIYG